MGPLITTPDRAPQLTPHQAATVTLTALVSET